MKKSRLLTAAVLFLLLTTVTGCSNDATPEKLTPETMNEYAETLTQISTIDALLNGIYDGVISYGDLKGYGDFGLGTFEGLDGEMIAFGGDFYQIKADGLAYEVSDSMSTPFAQMVFFDVDKTIELDDEITYDNLDNYIDNSIPTQNIFYAIKIEGTFDYIKTRSVPGQTKPYPPLVEVTASQPTFEFSDIKGTIAGFRSPPYMEGVGVPGYHLHFLTDDKSAGGHVLEIDVREATAYIDYTSGFFMILPGENSDFYDIDLTEDKSEELEEAEQ